MDKENEDEKSGILTNEHSILTPWGVRLRRSMVFWYFSEYLFLRIPVFFFRIPVFAKI
jgi:hypothetical protein